MAPTATVTNGRLSVRDDFAAWLHERLEELGWTPDEFSRRNGIPQADISAMLSGKQETDLAFLWGIAKAFEIPIDGVLRAAGLMPAVGMIHGEDALVSYYRRLPTRDRHLLLLMAWQLWSSHQEILAPLPSL